MRSPSQRGRRTRPIPGETFEVNADHVGPEAYERNQETSVLRQGEYIFLTVILPDSARRRRRTVDV